MITNKAIAFFSLAILYSIALPTNSKNLSSAPAEYTTSNQDSIGALGRIEPRSRVVRVSHNAGAEGVNLQKLFVQEGDHINKDETLALLADHDKKQADLEATKANIVALAAKLTSEKANLAYEENEYRRYESLATNSLASRSLLESKRLNFQQAQATIKHLQAEITTARANQKVAEEELKNTIIKAPLSGTILKIHAWPGERLTDNGLLEMADLSQIDIVAEVYETDLPKIKIGQNAEIQLQGINSTYTAIVREIGFLVKKNDQNDTDPLADLDNRIIEVRLTLDQKAASDLQHQIYRQVQVRIKM